MIKFISFQVEKLIQLLDIPLACTNSDNGCDSKLKDAEMKIHKIVCEFRKVPCPFERSNKCEGFIVRDALDHFKTHGIKVPELEEAEMESGKFDTEWIFRQQDPESVANQNQKRFVYFGYHDVMVVEFRKEVNKRDIIDHDYF